MPKIRKPSIAFVSGILTWLMVSGVTGASERDLYSGLAYLRAGSQVRAEESLTKFRDEERDPEIRRIVDRIMLLLKRPLSEEVREYLATNLEERVRVASGAKTQGTRPSYLSRMFPVFP